MNAELQLPAAVLRCAAPPAPQSLRCAVARGAIPLSPRDRLSVLLLLHSDSEGSVRDAAREAWRSLPERTLASALSDPELPEPVIHHLATSEPTPEPVLYRVLEHPRVGPRTLLHLCGSTSAVVLSHIAQNQRLLDQHPEIAERLLGNSALDPGERSRLASLYGLPEQPAPAVEEEAEELDLEQFDPDRVELPEDLPESLLEDPEAPQPRESGNLYQYVQSLKVADKIKLAMVGSKGARRLLIRDTNKIVSTAVIRSPKIREDEVLTIAQDRTVSEEIVRIILTRKDWMKNYPIRLALAQNPKTPIPRAVRILDTLQDRDLRQISKSRNVPNPVSTGALRVLARRGKT